MTVANRCILALLILLGAVLYFTKQILFALYLMFVGFPLLVRLCSYLMSLWEKRNARRQIAKGRYYYFKDYKIHFYKTDDRAVLLKAMRAAHDWWGSFDVDLDDAPYLRETVVELAAENNFLLRNQDLRAQVDALRMTRFRDKLKNAVRASAGQATAQANAAVARALIREAQNHLTH